MENIIEIRQLVKKYKEHEAVKGIDLDIKEGEIFGLLGPNGAGKTTTISMIVGILKISSGSIKIFGKDINKESAEIKKNIGYVPQDLAFFETMNAYDNVTYWGRLYGLSGKNLKKSVQEALEYTGLWDRRKDKASSYSGGMKRRLNIACAIVHKPKLLFMDEPTVGVDPQSRNSVLESIKELNKNGTTVVYTSHYMEEVEAICDRVAIMDFGKVIAMGTIDKLIADIVKDECVTLEIDALDAKVYNGIKSMNGVNSCEKEGSVINVHVDPNVLTTIKLIEDLIAQKLNIKAINVEKSNLESVFLSLTGKKLRD